MPKNKADSNWQKYSAFGFQFLATIAILGWLGSWADKRLLTSPWLTLLGLLIGIVGSLVKLVKDVGREN